MKQLRGLLRHLDRRHAYSRTPAERDCLKNRRFPGTTRAIAKCAHSERSSGWPIVVVVSKLAQNKLFCCKRATHGSAPVLRTDEGPANPQQFPLLPAAAA